uniref:Uncharacterized protein n=1 Tax=Toxocara canis TaxID=6265 RepID=A0A183UFN2_TOXCA
MVKRDGRGHSYRCVRARRPTAKAFAKNVFINQERKSEVRRRSDTALVLTKLTEGYHQEWSLRLNLTQHRKTPLARTPAARALHWRNQRAVTTAESKCESSAHVDYVPAPCTHRLSLPWTEPFRDKRGLLPSEVEILWWKPPLSQWLEPGKSRIKVSLGEPAEGSLSSQEKKVSERA